MSDAPALNIPLLERIREAGGIVALEALGPDRDLVLRDLGALEAFGFRLAWHPYGGVSYEGPAARLCPDQIEHELGTTRIGRRIAVWDRVSSTNDLAVRAGATEANEGLVILAEHQTAGRGRRGHAWEAPAGRSILMSAVLRPPTALVDVAWLTALGALAAAEVVESAGVDPSRVGIKWPNDVYVGTRKIAGVLVERRRGVALGIGLNANVFQEEFPEDLRAIATSLRIATGQDQDRSALARGLIRSLDAHYVRALAEGPGVLNTAWRVRLSILEQEIQLRTTAGRVAGRLISADLVDGLLLTIADGSTRRIALGEILSFDQGESSASG